MPALQVIALDTTTPQLRAPASGDTYSAPRALDITPETLTGSSATSSLSIAQTWNTSGTPTAIDLNVTDTASNAASLLMNLRVGGASRFSVTKLGTLVLGTAATNTVPNDYSNTGITLAGGAGIFGYAGGFGFFFGNGQKGLFAASGNTSFVLLNNYSLGFRSDSSTAAPDLILARDAANTLAQRNGVNAQAFRVYNTFTDASNYERLGIGFSSGAVDIAYQNAGSGSARYLRLEANTQINFKTSGVDYWSIQGAHLFAQVDNTSDIGAAAANRPRRLYLGGGSLTGSQADSSLVISPTWNTTGTPTAIDLNVTDTASNAASLLMNLQVGGSSRFVVDKTGAVVISDGSNALTIDSSNGATTFLQVPALQFQTSNSLIMRHGNNDALGVRAVSGASDPRFDFLNTSNALQVRLTIDAANTLAQRNGVNAQAFNIYNTYTDASNYERASIGWGSNILSFGMTAAGTGVQREVRLSHPNSRYVACTSTAIVFRNSSNEAQITSTGFTPTAGTQSIGSGSALWNNFFRNGYSEVAEMTAPAAPAADRVRIYAEDNGAGKTRLMALFATGAAQQIAIEP